MMDREKREKGIRAWWGNEDHPGLPLPSTKKDQDARKKLFEAFRRVLSAMSEKEFEKFWCEINPTVVCRPIDHGFAFRHIVTVRADNSKKSSEKSEPTRKPEFIEKSETRTVNVIYLAPWVVRRRAGRLTDLVAHEVAHHMLDHPAMFWGDNSETEKAADDLAERWGFKRSSCVARG